MPNAGLVVRRVSVDGPEARRLIESVQQEYVQRYGGPDETPVDPAEFDPPDGLFLVGTVDGEPVACGGLRRLNGDTVEVKRMFVVPEARRRGYAQVLLDRLEQEAVSAGYRQIVLETGGRQPEALALYTARGYLPVTPFGHYRDYPGVHDLGKSLVGGTDESTRTNPSEPTPR